MKELYVCILLLFTGCGRTIVDVQLQPYFNSFANKIHVSTAGVSGTIQPMHTQAIGVCDISSATITIDSTYWNTIDDSQREQLVFHELGHCAMGLQHVNTTQPDKCPTSIMYPLAFGDSPCYFENVQHYYTQLIGEKVL